MPRHNEFNSLRPLRMAVSLFVCEGVVVRRIRRVEVVIYNDNMHIYMYIYNIYTSIYSF